MARLGLWLEEPRHVDAATAAAELLLDLHLVGGRLRRVSRGGRVGAPAGVLEDYGCVASGWLDLFQATGEVRWLIAATDLIDTALERFAAGDGGFHDTADDAEQLVARPRDASDNASPSGLSSLIHALVTAAAITGEPRYRQAAVDALASVHALVTKAPRFAGWSLAAAVALRDGPAEIAVVGPPGARRASLANKAATIRPRWCWSPTRPATTFPSWWGATRSTGSRRRTCVATTSARPLSPTPPT